MPSDFFAHLFGIFILAMFYLNFKKQMSANHNQIIDS